jgi:hypothetical protein
VQGALTPRRHLPAAALLLAATLLIGCPYAPPQEGYRVRAPESGPSKLPPAGYRWQQDGACSKEEKRSVYNADTEAHTMCDWVIAREASPAASASGCSKDTDCKGDRICVIPSDGPGRCDAPR